MVEVRPIRLEGAAERKRRRVEALLAGSPGAAPGLREVVRDAQVLGSLELAGLRFDWAAVRAARARPEAAPGEIAGLQRAYQQAPARGRVGVASLVEWHATLSGGRAGLRSADCRVERPPPAAPGAFVAQRLAQLEEWLGESSLAELRPAARGALVLARLTEIRPFERANGRLARLAASRVMEAAAAEPPILVGGDAPRLEAALQRAFQLDTEPLVALLEEASERSWEVQLQALEAAPAPPA